MTPIIERLELGAKWFDGQLLTMQALLLDAKDEIERLQKIERALTENGHAASCGPEGCHNIYSISMRQYPNLIIRTYPAVDLCVGGGE